MITDSSASQTTSRSVISRPLKRGRACMNCRFLKIKCDGIKPICGPCRKHPKDDDCEYSDGPARSRTKALEDTVQRLEARLHELEHPDESTPSVTLYDPYSPFPPPPPPSGHPAPRLQIPHAHVYRSLPGTPYSALPRLLTPGGSSSSPESQGLAPLSPFSPPSTTASTPPFAPPGHGSSPLGIFDSRVAVATPESSASSLEFDSQLCDTLIQTFLPYAPQFGFFLDPQRFMPPTSPGTPPTPVISRISPPLLYALCTWGAHFSRARDRVREDHFVVRALQASATDLLSHPRALLHTLQAEVLLAYYFWRTGALMRARVHAASAGAIAIGAGLERVRAAQPSEAPILELGDPLISFSDHSPYAFSTGSGAGAGAEMRLPPAADMLEEGERIRAFWAVFVLQKALAVALDAPSRVCGIFENLQVDTPWPREIDEYKQGVIGGAEVGGQATVRRYLAGTSGASPIYAHEQYEQAGGDSISALLVKAHILLHRAVYMEGQWTSGVSQREQQALSAAFHSLGGLIDELRSQLPPRFAPQQRSYSPHSSQSSQSSSSSYSPEYEEHVDPRVRLAHALLDGATMRLNGMFMYTDANARAMCVRSAMDMLRDASMVQREVSPIVSPIMGTLWAAAVNVLADEMKRLRSVAAAAQTQPSQYDYQYEQDVSTCLNDGLATLQAGAQHSAMMRHEHGQAARDSAGVGGGGTGIHPNPH